jgi:hypothetical protein
MKPIPIAQYLSQLEGENPLRSTEKRIQRRESPFTKPRLVATSAEAPHVAAPDVPDIEARLAEAYERGAQAGRLEAHAEHAQRQAARGAEDENRLQKERQEFQAGEYAELADAIAAGLTEIEERISSVVASILEPYIAEQQAKLVVKALCADVDKLLSADAPPLLRISGPEEVLAVMRKRLAGRAIEVEYRLNDGVEASVEAHNTLIETQFQNWINLIYASKD